ncbi:MAG: hypothetical protein N3E51_05325 [Candidatus Micrarchaeota archaeon]|nr:hypothetical protein [Candidatus Micrarchaeota archaeon]
MPDLQLKEKANTNTSGFLTLNKITEIANSNNPSVNPNSIPKSKENITAQLKDAKSKLNPLNTEQKKAYDAMC